MTRVKPELAGIPETMLWTLHGRASEAKRPNGILRDPMAAKIFDSIDYDFEKTFGQPNILFAVRAALIDSVLREWLRLHPNGLVVSLGEGLETQALRVDNGLMRWLSVDLPEVIRIRALFLAPTERFRHLAANALDAEWMDGLDQTSGLFIVAQGLFMYLEPGAVEYIFVNAARRFPGAEMIFDIVPRSMSALTLARYQQTAFYELPSMPWGLNRNEVAPTLKRWHPTLRKIRLLPYRVPSGRPALVENILDRVAWRRNGLQSLVHVSI
ncbi:MAG TPA: class I SAM-dependent methyltransferase [Methylocella sp.]|nr:class I SAM-dependent methyltransferase [Methylocella sp.]